MADRTMCTVMLPLGPIESRLRTAARDDDRGMGEWLRHHPRGGTNEHRTLLRARHRGTVSAPVADRWAVHLLGLTLDEIYGPCWDDQEDAVA